MDAIEIAIIGGGPAGIACAIMLAKANMQVCVIERQHVVSWKPGEIFDSQICMPLQRLGIWEDFLETNPMRTCGTNSAWGGDFIEKSAMIDPFGGALFVDRNSFENLMRNAARDAGVLFLEGTSLLACSRSGPTWRLSLHKNEETFQLNVGYLIEANGRGKSYCDKGEREDYDMMIALLGYANLSQDFRDLRFHIEAFDCGWAYAAPLPDQSAVLAFLTDAYCLPRGKKNQQQFYHDQINKLELMEILQLHEITPAKVVSAKSSIRKMIYGTGWMAIGEAAATYDPITGWGVLSALEKGIMAADLLREHGMSLIGKYYDEYERTRFSEYLQTRKTIYTQEQRWSHEDFWIRRHSAHAVTSTS